MVSIELVEGNIVNVNVRKNGDSLYVLIPPEVAKYLGVSEGTPVVMKCEKSQKWGNYIGVGKNKME